MLFTEHPQRALIQPTKSEYLQLKPIQMTLGDLIRTDYCHEAISVEMVELLTPNVQRLKTHATILDLLTQCFRVFDPTLKIHPFGSNVYSFNGSKTNYNILIDTRKCSFKHKSIGLFSSFGISFFHREVRKISGIITAFIFTVFCHIKRSERI